MYTDQIGIVYGGQCCSISVLSSEYQYHNNGFAKSITTLPFLISEGLVDLNTLQDTEIISLQQYNVYTG